MWHCNVTSNATITTYTSTTVATIIYRQLMQGDQPRDYLPVALKWLLENVRTALAWSIILLCHILYSWRVLVFRMVILSLHMHDTAYKTTSSPQKDFFNKHLRYCLKDQRQIPVSWWVCLLNPLYKGHQSLIYVVVDDAPVINDIVDHLSLKIAIWKIGGIPPWSWVVANHQGCLQCTKQAIPRWVNLQRQRDKNQCKATIKGDQ